MPRPMTDQADYVTGAFTPRTWRKAADVKLRESTTPAYRLATARHRSGARRVHGPWKRQNR